MIEKKVLDVSDLPEHAFGPRMTMWWGTLGFCALEGMGFLLAAFAYLYLAWLNPSWPLNAAPLPLFWSTVFTVVLVASALPNFVIKKAAVTEDLPRIQVLILVMAAVGLGLLLIRVFEFRALTVQWDENAYGSLVWLLLGLHTVHLLTDVIDTLVLAALMFTRHAKGKRFSDVEDNAFYWNFVVLSWLPLYALLYGFPRT
jgi:heme/copper-type cytochrome/quinol oxidase subunit 3